MKTAYWVALPLILGISTLSVACGEPAGEVEEEVGEEEVLEEEGIGEEDPMMEEEEPMMEEEE